MGERSEAPFLHQPLFIQWKLYPAVLVREKGKPYSSLTPVHLYGAFHAGSKQASSDRGSHACPALYSERKDITWKKQVTVPITHNELIRRERCHRTENPQRTWRKLFILECNVAKSKPKDNFKNIDFASKQLVD